MKLLMGNSGCKLELLEDGLVKKSIDDKKYIKRLILQAKKQQEFSRNFRRHKLSIDTPKIISLGENYFVMEYINGLSSLKYLTESSKYNIDIFLDKIFFFIDNQLKKSKNEDCKEKILLKLISINNNNQYNVVNKLIKKVEKQKEIILPIAKCHGDLTFSNIIISPKNKIYFIDFLDSFIDSPAIDIVKLRQDTNHHWCLYNLKIDYELDPIRVLPVFEYIDNLIYNKVAVQYWYKNYNILQGVNFSRILPYIQNKFTEKYILNQINLLLEYA